MQYNTHLYNTIIQYIIYITIQYKIYNVEYTIQYTVSFYRRDKCEVQLLPRTFRDEWNRFFLSMVAENYQTPRCIRVDDQGLDSL